VLPSRETARLKNKLANTRGSKRDRDDEDDGRDQPLDDDEEESRTGAIQKKAKLDVFGHTSPQMTPQLSHTRRHPQDAVAMEVNRGGDGTPNSSANASVVSLARPPNFSQKKKKKRKKLTSVPSDPKYMLPTPSSSFDHTRPDNSSRIKRPKSFHVPGVQAGGSPSTPVTSEGIPQLNYPIITLA
jgi:hypothetical protein